MRILSLALCLLMSVSSAAATLGAGLAAYERGDFGAARNIVEPLADAGDAQAQYLMGRMHARGEGVLQDYIVAHKWLNLAAARGYSDARAERDAIARQMTPSQIAAAQEAARAWQPKRVSSTSSTSASSPAAAPATSSRGPNSGNVVKDIQTMLAELGYDPGPADGVMGRRTRSAIRTYQLHSDLPVNGQPSSQLRGALAADLGYESAEVASSAPRTVTVTPAADPKPASSSSAPVYVQEAQQQSNTPVYVQESKRTQAQPPARSSARARPADGAVQDLARIVEDGAARRRADRAVIEQLRELVARHDRPWRRTVVEERFRDGDFTRNPTWRVVSGRFWIDRSGGLRSKVGARNSNNSRSQQDAAAALLGALLGQKSGGARRSGPASIALPVQIAPVFAVEMELVSGAARGELEVGLYRGANADSSLRLKYNPGAARSLTLTRQRGERVRRLAMHDRRLNLEDGRRHLLLWTRDRDGRMQISVDGTVMLDTSASGGRGRARGFDGFFLTNRGGNFGLRSLRIDVP